MKTAILKLVSVLPLFGLIGWGCEKEDKSCACGLEDPQTNIEWLKSSLNKRFCTEVYTFHFEEKEYIAVCDCPEMIDALIIIYDCEGKKVCEWGGVALGASCSMPTTFTFEYYEKNKKLIFKQQ